MLEYYIGEEYSQKEFELEYVKTKIIKGIAYDFYEYLEFSNVEDLNLYVVTSILVYNCDRLKGVYFVLKSIEEFG